MLTADHQASVGSTITVRRISTPTYEIAAPAGDRICGPGEKGAARSPAEKLTAELGGKAVAPQCGERVQID
jgi:hypothetical protein